MPGCPRGPTGKDCGCDSEFESEWECDPCSQGQCREWQRTPNFPRSLPVPHVDPCTQQILRNVRIVTGTTLGSLIVGGWMYHKYLHYMTAREEAKAKKAARARPKQVKHEHLRIVAPPAASVPDVKKEVAKIDTKSEVNPLSLGPNDMKNKPLRAVVPAAALVPDVNKDKEFGKVETKTEKIPVSGGQKEMKNIPLGVVPVVTSLPEVKKDLVREQAKSEGRPVRVGPKKVINKGPRLSAPASASGPVPDVKNNVTKVETKSGGSKEVKNKRMGVAAPASASVSGATSQLGKVGTTSQIESNGGIKEGEKKTAEDVVFTVYTQGKKGENVKRRGWK